MQISISCRYWSFTAFDKKHIVDAVQFWLRGQTNGKAGKQAAVPSWAKATKKVVVKCWKSDI
jgi:hypothetical protein